MIPEILGCFFTGFFQLLDCLAYGFNAVSKQACIGRIVNIGFYSCAVNS
jgi:hypothetical protein